MDNKSNSPTDTNKNTKRLIVLRGYPGSGKSTLAKQLVEDAEDVDMSTVVCCCDDFFMVNGEYRFDGAKLALNHEKCLKKAKTAIDQGVSLVIIDNTNTCLAEFKAYVQYALNADYIVSLMEPDTPWGKARDVLVLLQKNTHGVPQRSYEKMMDKWEETDNILEEIANSLGCEVDIVSQSVWC